MHYSSYRNLFSSNLCFILVVFIGAEVRRLMNKAFKAPLVLQQQQVIRILVGFFCLFFKEHATLDL